MNWQLLTVLHTFLPDRTHHNRRVAAQSGLPINYVSNATRSLVTRGYLEKVIVATKRGKPNKDGRPITNYFQLTEAGRQLAQQYDRVREAKRTKIVELMAGGMSAAEAAVVTTESSESDNST